MWRRGSLPLLDIMEQGASMTVASLKACVLMTKASTSAHESSASKQQSRGLITACQSRYKDDQ